MGVLVNGLELTEFLQFLDPSREFVHLSGNPFRPTLKLVFEFGLAIFDNFCILLKHGSNVVHPRQSASVQLDIFLGKNVHIYQVEQVLLGVLNVLLRELNENAWRIIASVFCGRLD